MIHRVALARREAEIYFIRDRRKNMAKTDDKKAALPDLWNALQTFLSTHPLVASALWALFSSLLGKQPMLAAKPLPEGCPAEDCCAANVEAATYALVTAIRCQEACAPHGG